MNPRTEKIVQALDMISIPIVQSRTPDVEYDEVREALGLESLVQE
jgi:hypothetical protein